MEMPTPTDAHRRLQVFAGMWVGKETMAPSPWDPEGSTVEARIANRVALDGFVIVQDYAQIRDGKATFRGHGVIGWDTEAEQAVMHWWDTMGGTPNVFRGDWAEDGTLVMEHRSERGGSRSHMRIDDGVYRFRMEVSRDGETFATWMTGEYRAHPADYPSLDDW